MKTLTSPSSGILVGESGRSSSGDPLVGRPESFFRPIQRFVRVGVLHLASASASARRRAIKPVFSLSSEPQVDLDVVDDKGQEIHHSKTVHVKFQIQKECSFGNEFLLVGDDPMLGLWDPDNGIPMTWSDDHVWTVEMDMPIGKTIQYKFILKESTGTILWQPGPDRVFQSWETINTITVSEEWEDAENQKLIEDDGFVSPNTESIVNSEVSVDEKLTYPKEDLVSKTSNGSVAADKNSNPAGKLMPETPQELVFTGSIPSQEKPVAIVADNVGKPNNDFVTKEPSDNIGTPKKDHVAKEHPEVFDDKKITGPPKMETLATPNKDKVIAKDALEQNSRVPEVKNTTTDAGKNQTTSRGSPFSVPNPGLISVPSTVATPKPAQIESEESSSFDASDDGPSDTNNFNAPELDKKQEPGQQETTETFNNEEEHHVKLKYPPLSAKEEEQELPENEEHHAKLVQHPLSSQEEGATNSEPIKGVFGNDVKWGLRTTLQKLLANLGLA